MLANLISILFKAFLYSRFQLFPTSSVLLGSATVVWVCLRTREFPFAPWIYCAYVDPHFRSSYTRPPPSPALSPPSKHADPATCSRLYPFLPSNTPPDPPDRRRLQDPTRALLTAVMTRGIINTIFRQQPKTLLTFTRALRRLYRTDVMTGGVSAGNMGGGYILQSSQRCQK